MVAYETKVISCYQTSNDETERNLACWQGEDSSRATENDGVAVNYRRMIAHTHQNQKKIYIFNHKIHRDNMNKENYLIRQNRYESSINFIRGVGFIEGTDADS